MQKTVNKFLMSRENKSPSHNKLTQQLHAKNQTATKQKKCWDSTI